MRIAPELKTLEPRKMETTATSRLEEEPLTAFEVLPPELRSQILRGLPPRYRQVSRVLEESYRGELAYWQQQMTQHPLQTVHELARLGQPLILKFLDLQDNGQVQEALR